VHGDFELQAHGFLTRLSLAECGRISLEETPSQFRSPLGFRLSEVTKTTQQLQPAGKLSTKLRATDFGGIEALLTLTFATHETRLLRGHSSRVLFESRQSSSHCRGMGPIWKHAQIAVEACLAVPGLAAVPLLSHLEPVTHLVPPCSSRKTT
jgi:hypothetical protein